MTLDIRQLARRNGIHSDYDIPEDRTNEDAMEVDIRRL